MKTPTTVVASTGPMLVDILGIDVPVLPMFMGLAAVVLVRVMLMAKDFKNDKAFWYYNVSLTILMVVVAFAVIADRQLGPGMAVMVGTGIGASGMVLVDILKDRTENVIRALIGNKEEGN